MDKQRKYAILFAATILAARKLNESGCTPWAVHVAITDAIEKANRILKRLTSDGPRQAPRRCRTKNAVDFVSVNAAIWGRLH
jgi:hypothetical protein